MRGSQAQDWFSFLYLGFECRDALMRTFLISALIAAIPTATATAADVPFLQAAIFFFLGLEPPHVTMATETKPGVKEKATLPSGTIFLVPEDEPCKVQWLASRQLNSPKQEMILIDFAKIPSPRAMTVTTNAFGVVTVTYEMPPGAWCDGWYDLSTTPPGKLIKVDCWPGNSFTGAINRRLQALDYIRNNFCAGLPEPPPPPPP